MASKFLTAEWRKLAMANYAVDPEVLKPFLPARTELDLWNNTCYVSLVGFMFLNTKLKGIPIPFHTNFEEVNLRFYVKHLHNGEWRRGVVFIKEIVPKPALTFVANTIYKEHYETMPMRHEWKDEPETWKVSYSWRTSQWNSFAVTTEKNAVAIPVGSEEEFITEHYWGYTKTGDNQSSEYGVEHPRWDVYPVIDYQIDVNFREVYGQAFEFLKTLKPVSVFLAEGSPIVVRSGRKV